MDTPELVRACAWRFYAGRYLNSARIGAEGTTFTPAMTIKGFFACEAAGARSAEQVRERFRRTIAEAYPALAWRFGRTAYEPHRFAYDAQGVLHPFDYANEVCVEPVSRGVETFRDFVEDQCRLDDTHPQVFGEALRCRFAIGPDGRIFARFGFNHALVDGIMIFKFMTAWEPLWRARGGRLLDLDAAGPARARRWRTAQTEYTVEHVNSEDHPRLAARGFDYTALLYELAKGRWLTRIRQAIALPRDPLAQLAIAPVPKALGYEAFKRRNEAQTRRARDGTPVSGLLEEYRNDPVAGDEYIRRLMSYPRIGRQLSAWVAGDMIVSSYMFRHPRYLAFPVVHPLQREGLAICCVWTHDGVTTARITRVRQRGGPRPAGASASPGRDG